MSVEALTVRFATSVDVPAIVALVESAYRGEESRGGWTTEADLLGGQRTDAEEIAALVADAKARVLLAERGGTMLGCILARLEEGEGYIGMLAVRPLEQRAGVGRHLLSEAERTLRRKFGARRVRMMVLRQREELIEWYARRGYHRTERIVPFPYDNPRFGMPQRSDLAFRVLEKPLP